LAYTLLSQDSEAQRDADRAIELGFDAARLKEDIESLKRQR
jgi:hypothetical protein